MPSTLSHLEAILSFCLVLFRFLTVLLRCVGGWGVGSDGVVSV